MCGLLNIEIQKGKITKHRYHRPVIQAAPMRITRNSGKASASNGRILFNLSLIEKPHIDKLRKMSYAMVNYSERKSNNILLQISYSRTKSLERKSYWRIVCFIVVAYSERNKIKILLRSE